MPEPPRADWAKNASQKINMASRAFMAQPSWYGELTSTVWGIIKLIAIDNQSAVRFYVARERELQVIYSLEKQTPPNIWFQIQQGPGVKS